MKYLSLFLTAIGMMFFTSTAHAQQSQNSYKYKLGNSADKSIEFSVSRSDVTVEGHNSDDVVIQNMDYEAPPSRAKGLHALYNSAEDNTGIGLSVQEDGNTLKVVSVSNKGGKFKLLVPNKVRVKLEEVNFGGGNFELSNLQGEIEIKSKTANMKLNNVTGPVIANSVSGNLEMTLDALSQAGPTSVALISGFIDITMPADSKANLSMGSISGDIYSDMNIQTQAGKDHDPKKNDMPRLGGGNNISGTLNGGGVDVNLKSISGNIYLRKK